MKNGDQSMNGTISLQGEVEARRPRAEELGDGDGGSAQSIAKPPLDGLGVGDELALAAAGERLALLLLEGSVLAVELGAGLGAVQPVDDADAPRGVLARGRPTRDTAARS